MTCKHLETSDPDLLAPVQVCEEWLWCCEHDAHVIRDGEIG